MSYISIFPILGYQKEKKKYFSTLISIFVYVGEWSSTPHSQLIWLQSMKVTAILMQRLQDFVSNNNKTFYLGPAGPSYSSLFPVAPAIIVSLLILLKFPSPPDPPPPPPVSPLDLCCRDQEESSEDYNQL